MHIITIHGIRRQKKWYVDFKKLPYWENTNVKIENYDYGYLSLLHFIIPFFRNKPLEDFQTYYSDNFDPNLPPNLLCHSFGTFIFYSAIRKYPSIKFNKVILCGSILNRGIDWEPFFENKQISNLLNDYGQLDSVVKYSRLVLFKSSGTSGKKGFLNVPAKYQNNFVQRNNLFGHSDYFLKLNMQENWAKYFYPQKKQFSYNKEILRTEIIERVYNNICNTEIEYTTLTYNGRIDDKGNYFAHYIKEGLNRSNNDLNELNLITTADSTNTEEDMWFEALDLNGNKIESTINNDTTHKKSFVILFKKSIKKNKTFGIQYRFRWKETINFKSGDTDHFEIHDASIVNITLNFKYILKSPKFFILKDRNLVDEIIPEHKTENDGTTTYLTQYKNDDNNDGMIFYFTGSNTPTIKKPRITSPSKKSNTFFDSITIHKCTKDLIKDVYKIELGIEFTNAASEIVLKQRLSMFEDGFLVAKQNDEIIGYIESVIWNDYEFETFEEIKNFPLHYNVNGDTLYIIFLGVHPDKRKNGVGEKLITALEKTATNYGVKQIKLVAKDDLIKYYKKFGFKEVRELPNFLENHQYKSMLMNKQITN